MRSIQDPKKRKLIEKKPVVTSQDPDFPVSLLSDPGKAVTYSSVDDLIRDGFTHDNGEHWFKMLPDGDIVEANYVPPQLRSLDPVGLKTIDTGYSQPEIIETPPTPMLTGRQAVQVGRVAQDRENARYGQVLDKEYYWDDDLKRWQMRPVDEERLGKPFPRNDRKYRLIKASF
jgi:hypothetical protein